MTENKSRTISKQQLNTTGNKSRTISKQQLNMTENKIGLLVNNN